MERKVKVYSTPSCSYCIRLKQYLESAGVDFENIDVSGDEKAAEEMISLSGQIGVPVVDIEGEIIVGFDKEKISKALGLV